MCWKLADFGTASQATSKRLNTTRDARGSQGYRAPEIFQSRYNQKSDIFALGCLVYEVVTGAKLFCSDGALIGYVERGILPESTWWPPTSAGEPDRMFYLEKLVASMLERDSGNRPSARLVLQSLKEIRDGCLSGSEAFLTGDDKVPIQVALPSRGLTIRDVCPRRSCRPQKLAKYLLKKCARSRTVILSH
jgi:serine/threonine protein kinase